MEQAQGMVVESKEDWSAGCVEELAMEKGDCKMKSAQLLQATEKDVEHSRCRSLWGDLCITVSL